MKTEIQEIKIKKFKIEEASKKRDAKIYPYMRDENFLVIPIWEYDAKEEFLYSVTADAFTDIKVIENIIFADEIVIKDSEIEFCFDYNISKTIKKTNKKSKGFSRINILEGIYNGFREIYALNDPSVFDWPDYIRDISELFIEDVIYNVKEKGLHIVIGT